MNDPVRWGVLGCAKIAINRLLPGMVRARGAKLHAVASRSLNKAREVANKFEAPVAYGSYEDLLADPEIEAVYIPLPNNLHMPWSISAVQAGKHVLCEKPIALNANEAKQMQAAAREADRFLLEAFMYRFTPLMRKAVALVRAGAVGEIRGVHSRFSFKLGEDPTNIRLNPELGGGALYDAGCYSLNIVRLLAGREPLAAWAKLIHPSGFKVDIGGAGILDFGAGVLGTFTTSIDSRWESYFRVSGTTGILEAPAGFIGREQRPVLRLVAEHQPESLELHSSSRGDEGWEIPCEPVDAYMLQVEDLCAAIRGERQPLFGAEPLEANMRLIDACFESDRSGRLVSMASLG